MGSFSPKQRGLTLVKRGGAWEALSKVSHFELEAAESYYLGGHRHEISLEIGAELVVAGFVTAVLDEAEQVGAFEGVPDWSVLFPKEPEEEPEGMSRSFHLGQPSPSTRGSQLRLTPTRYP